MTTSLSIKFKAIELRELAFGSIGAAYTAIGLPIDHSLRMIRIQNLTDALLRFSYDGVTDNEILAPNSDLILDITANKGKGDNNELPKLTTIYVKQDGVPTAGGVYISGNYGG